MQNMRKLHQQILKVRHYMFKWSEKSKKDLSMNFKTKYLPVKKIWMNESNKNYEIKEVVNTSKKYT